MPGVRIVTIKPTSLEDVFGDIITIAGSMGVPERGSQMVGFMRARFDLVRSMTANLTPQPPKVVHLEWLQPLMGSGYWIAECVESAGCTMIHGTVGGHSQTLESLSTLDSADVIIIAPCGFSIERTFAEINQIQLDKQDQWKTLPAVNNGRVFVADGNLYFNRSSCGVLDTAEIVAECAHDSLRGMWGHHGRTFVQMAELANFCNRDGAPPATKWVELAPADVVVRNNVIEGSEGSAPIRDSPTEASSAVQHVKEQLTALQASDWAAAFALNSAANQARLGSGEQFKAIVHGNPSFSLLLKESGVKEIAATQVCLQPTLSVHFCTGLSTHKFGHYTPFRSVQFSSVPFRSFSPTWLVPQVSEGFMKAVVRVDVEGGEAATRFLFDLLRGSKEGAWETEGVRIEC
jgi:hypothetical protein